LAGTKKYCQKKYRTEFMAAPLPEVRPHWQGGGSHSCSQATRG
jgi:hypothetical protein